MIDPYVLLELFGVPRDCTDYRTRTAPNNSGGFPIFDMPFEFRLSLPSLALVRFVVLDDDYIGDEFIGELLCAVMLEEIAIGAGGLGFNSRAGQTGHSVATPAFFRNCVLA